VIAGLRPRHAILGLLLAVALGCLIPVAVAGPQDQPDAGEADTAPSSGPAGELIVTATLPDHPISAVQNGRLPGSIDNDRQLVLGGVGSDLWRGPADPPGEFWMVTDRGPNGQVRIDGSQRRTFAVPGFTPIILRVRVDGSTIQILETLPIVNQSGGPVTGLPNIEGHEEPYDYTGQTRLALNPNGLDVEGLVRTPAGDFWAADEYAPSLVHIDSTGKVLRRLVPHGVQIDGADYPVVAALPAIFSTRTPNRGFEGLTLSADGRTLYLGIQSPLSNPDARTGNTSRIVRILAFDIASEQATAEYVYPIGWSDESESGERPGAEPKPERAAKPERATKPSGEPKPDRTTKPSGEPKPERVAKPERAPRPDTVQTRLSALATVGPTTLLVLERTSSDARLYLVDLSGATSILSSSWDDPTTVPSLEAVVDPVAEGVPLLSRAPIVDLSTIAEMPDKIEGVAIVDRSTVAVANDNDFDLGSFDPAGNNVGQGLQSKILLVSLPQPLP
jgi:hypothetical protein